MAAVLERPRSRRLSEFIPIRFREAEPGAVDDRARTAKVVIITEGLGNLKDRNYYTPEAVKSCASAFEGRQFFLDHPTTTEDDERPERSVRDLAGYFFDCRDGDTEDADTHERLAASFGTLRFADSEPGRLAFDQVRTALEYQQRFPGAKNVYAGISVNAGGVSHPGTIRGMPVNIVTEITEAFSADIVTKPARGGRFLALARESVAGGSAGIAAKVAEWKRRGTRDSGRRAEAQRAMEGGMARQRRQKFTAETAAKVLGKLREGEGDSVAALAEKLGKVRTMTGEAGDAAAALLDDIMADLGQLQDVLGGAEPGGEPGVAGEGEGEGEDEARRRRTAEGEGEARRRAAEGRRRRTGEGEGEDEARTGEGEGEDEDEVYGMRGAGEDEDEGEVGQQMMRYQCEGCGAENRVLPPRGFGLRRVGDQMRVGESDRGRRGRSGGADQTVQAREREALRMTVARLRHQMEAKESRFAEANVKTRTLLTENIALRAEVAAERLLREAKRQIREANVPRDILPPEELVLVERGMWPGMIRMAQRQVERESGLYRVGAGPSNGRLIDRQEAKPGEAAVAAYRETYRPMQTS